MITDKQEKEIRISLMLYELFDDKSPQTADDVRNYCEYLTDLLNAAAEDYINDNELEN